MQCFGCWCCTSAEAMKENLSEAGGGLAQGAGWLHSAIWGNLRGGRRARGRLKAEVKVTIGGDRPSR